MSDPDRDDADGASDDDAWRPARSVGESSGLFPDAGAAPRRRSRPDLVLRPEPSYWSFDPVATTDARDVRDEGDGGRTVPLGQGDDGPARGGDVAAVGGLDDAPVGASDDVPHGVSEGGAAASPSAGSDRRRLARRVVVALVAVVLAGVVVTVVTGRSEERAAGPRLPEAIDERWARPLDGRYLMSAIVLPDAVVAFLDGPGVEGALVGYDPVDGSQRWSRPFAADVVSMIPVGTQLVVSASADFGARRSAVSIDPVDGGVGWERDGAVTLHLDTMGHVAVFDGDPSSTDGRALQLVDLETGSDLTTVGVAAADLVGLVADGDVLASDGDGRVHRVDISSVAEGSSELESMVVATTSSERRNVVGLGGRWFAAGDGGLVEIGFTADSARVLTDARPDDDRELDLVDIGPDSVLWPIDERHVLVLGTDGAMGIQLVDDELRVNWVDLAAVSAPRSIDGGRVAVEVVTAAENAADDAGFRGPVSLIDVRSGEEVTAVPGTPMVGNGRPVVNGALGWVEVDGIVGGDPWTFDATAVAADLGGDERWRIDRVHAAPVVGDRVVVVGRGDGDETAIAMFDEGPRNRPDSG